ncbi:MAG TPA: hypothetical protein H9951_20110 [Candidatus Bacteroides intestinigallinarum]|nr:hypothetical protein [Candidatus Bacteroides intestinigallinarum]
MVRRRRSGRRGVFLRGTAVPSAGFFCRAAAGSWGGVSGDGPAAAFGPGEAAEVEGPWIKISR